MRSKKRRHPKNFPAEDAKSAIAMPIAATPNASALTEVIVELGDLRIRVAQAEDVPTVLQPLMQVANQKSLSQWFGVSPRTLRRWELEGKLPPWEGRTLAQVVSRLVTLPGSGA